MDTPTYKRGQVTWALWQTFARNRTQKKAPIGPFFATRIKRLLETDWAMGQSRNTGFAFTGRPPEGTGRDVQYTSTDAFCLAVGMDMLDAGFKQGEIVFFLRHTRPALEREHSWIRRDPPANDRQRLDPAKHPDRPTYMEDGTPWADLRVYMIVEKVELRELYPAIARQIPPGDPFFFHTEFSRGIEKLTTELQKLGESKSKAMVFEIASIASGVDRNLAKAPAMKRGRS